MAAHNHHEATGHAIWTKIADRRLLKKTKLSEKLPVNQVAPPLPPPLPKDNRLSRRAMCGRKVKHRSAWAAQLAIDNCPFDKEFLNTYRCLYCGKWHVGHIIKPTAPSPAVSA